MRARVLSAAVCGCLLAGPTGLASGAPEQAASLQTAAPPKREYGRTRWAEDYRFLRDTPPDDFWDPIKYLPLSGDGQSYLSFGGDARWRYEYWSAPFLGSTPVQTDAFQFLRIMPHAHFNSPWVKVFAQPAIHRVFQRQLPPRPIDEDRFDVQQAFAEIHTPQWATTAYLRVGRMEMPLGAGRMVGLRDGFNVRRAFDGARLGVSRGAFTLDLMGVASVELKPGMLDDEPRFDERLWGAYLSRQNERAGFDVYYLGLRRPDASYVQLAGEEVRHSLGLRGVGQVGAIDYDVELVGQTGSAVGSRIRAFAIMTEVGLRLSARPPLKILVRTDAFSGDRVAGDGELGTYNPYFIKQDYFSQLAIIHPTNVYDLHPIVRLRPIPALGMGAEAQWFWRFSVGDTIYQPPQVAIFDMTGERGRFLGRQVTAWAVVAVDRHFEITLYASHFGASAPLRRVGGKDTVFGGGWANYAF